MHGSEIWLMNVEHDLKMNCSEMRVRSDGCVRLS